MVRSGLGYTLRDVEVRSWLHSARANVPMHLGLILCSSAKANCQGLSEHSFMQVNDGGYELRLERV